MKGKKSKKDGQFNIFIIKKRKKGEFNEKKQNKAIKYYRFY